MVMQCDQEIRTDLVIKSVCLYNTEIMLLWMCLRDTKPSVK